MSSLTSSTSRAADNLADTLSVNAPQISCAASKHYLSDTSPPARIGQTATSMTAPADATGADAGPR